MKIPVKVGGAVGLSGPLPVQHGDNLMADLMIGLMSGTSMDAIDAALVEMRDAPTLLACHSQPIPASHQDSLLRCITAPEQFGVCDLGKLDIQLGELFADAALALLKVARRNPGEITGIGSHGQTVLHQPQGQQRFSIQLGDPNTIAERTGITTVADFRGRDLAAGGEGAPLAPAFHAQHFSSREEHRVILNLGGIANITVLPADAGTTVSGFDTGPANTLLDGWCQQHRQEKFDEFGTWAASGEVHKELLNTLLADLYFKQDPPKSTGREYFNMRWLETTMARVHLTHIAPEDVQATLAKLTAHTVAEAIKYAAPYAQRVIVCGGGVHNSDLMRRLREHLGSAALETTQKHGIDPDWVEAMAFAWLAKQTLEQRHGNIPSVTGAEHPVVLGAVYQGSK